MVDGEPRFCIRTGFDRKRHKSVADLPWAKIRSAQMIATRLSVSQFRSIGHPGEGKREMAGAGAARPQCAELRGLLIALPLTILSPHTGGNTSSQATVGNAVEEVTRGR